MRESIPMLAPDITEEDVQGPLRLSEQGLVESPFATVGGHL